MHYDKKKDARYCFLLIEAKEDLIACFIKSGFTNWRKSFEKEKDFEKHECCDAHSPNEIIDPVDNLLSDNCASDKAENCQVLYKIVENFRFPVRQSLPLRGNWSQKAKYVKESNFIEFLLLRGRENPNIMTWLQKKQKKYNSFRFKMKCWN